jgi:hypothetical protein
MTDTPRDLEKFWAAILSEDAAQVLAEWRTLDADEGTMLREHLERMIADEEMSDQQRQAARAALQIIGAP